MSSNYRRICEYFLISGFNKTRHVYDLSQIFYQGEEIVNANVKITEDFFHYKEPVVDIQIVNGNFISKLPKEYHVVQNTYSNQNRADLCGKSSVDELFLCFRYGRDEPPITDIWAFNLKQKNTYASDQWTLIEKTKNGHSANLSSSSSNPLFIAYKRAPANAPVDNLAVTDICIILANKNELCPPAYSRVDVPIKRSPLSHTINICYKKSMVKQNVLSFQPGIIYCLPCTSTEPIVDVYNPDPNLVKPESCLPDDISDVANFCMPWGATLESWSLDRSIPKPSFLTFVLTNINYNRMYGAAVLFYEEMNEDELTEDEIAYFRSKNSSQNCENTKIYCSKSLCLLSRWPLFQTFNQVLSFLIHEDENLRSNQSLNLIPIERYISQFLHTVAFPTSQAPNILLQWDLEHPIGIQLPTDALSRFGTGENFYHLIRMLDVEQIIQLFVYMLTEQKILLTSTCNSDLTGIAEALIAMIFPFKWSVVYIPFLYLRCIHIIQSPSPYLIGVDSRFFDFFRLPEGVGCIDLITKSIKPPENNCKYLDYSKVLPKSVLKSLRNGLSNCKIKVTSFEKQQNLRKTTGNVMDEFTILRKRESIGESIRECFLRAVILMFRNYQNYLIPVSISQKKDNMFDIEGFLKSVDRNCRILYQAIFDTQLWSNFILERSYATEFDDGLAFFDRCIKYMRDMNDETANAASLLQTDSVIKSEHTKVVPPPDPPCVSLTNLPNRTFPKRLSSHLMLPSIHITSNMHDENGDDDNHSDLNYVTPFPTNSDKHGSTISLTSPDSTIPVLLITPDYNINVSGNMRNRRSIKVTMLKRPVEEQKQARLMGKEAKYGQSYAWAGHLLSSSYCLWFLSLPGLIGYVEETEGLKETGLTERILQLALVLLDTMNGNRLYLPDEVCYRVLLILIHQIRPNRLHVSELLKHNDLNAFSYGLCNQIILEQEQQLSQKMLNLSTSMKQEKVEIEVLEQPNSNDKDSKDEKDCDSGRETLASANIAPEEAQDSSDSGCNVALKTGHCSIEIGGKAVQLRGRYQAPRNRKDRVSQLIVNSPLELCSHDLENSHQFFDTNAGIIMSATDRSPFLAMYRSPKLSEEIMSPKIPHSNADSSTHAIIARTPFSEEKSELHSSFLIKKRLSIDSSSNASDKDQSTQINSSDIVANVITTFREIIPQPDNSNNFTRPRMSDSRLTQSDFSSEKVSNKTRASFRQIKNVANKSLRSMRNIVSTMGSASWLTSPDGKYVPESNSQKPMPAGLPTPFRPWSQTGNNHGTGMNLEYRLKTTASADLLDTIGDHHTKVYDSKVCASTVQQLRRNTNLSGTHWTNSESCESFSSDKFEDSSTTSLDTEPPFVYVDKIYDKVTGSLGAIRLPTGKYWPDDQVDGDSPTPFIECTQSINVQMTTCTDCVYCHQSVYDDDIMNGWSYDDSDLQSLCPYCNDDNKKDQKAQPYRFTPKLTYYVYITHPESENSKSKILSLAYTSSSNYLSPFVLRKELESVLDQEGEIALLKPEFLNEHGILYWNLLWYYSRLGLPTHLLSFLTIWLRGKGESLAAASESNKNKYKILVDLTGFEQVIVTQFWELTQSVPPLYRVVSNPNNSDIQIKQIQSVLNGIMNNNLSSSIEALLLLRIHKVKDGSIVVKNIYRDLFHLIIVTLNNQVNYDVFNFGYYEPWLGLKKKYHEYIKSQDNPPPEQTLFCRKFFRPLQLA